jgi:histidine triad (HIT) family protein
MARRTLAFVACLFCSIVAGDAPATIVASDDEVVAFLDIKPLFPGHVLMVPRVHVETLADLPTEHVGPLFERVATMELVVEHALGAQGAFVAINNRVSQSVPHLHVHVVPRTKGDGLKGFFWPRTKYASPEQQAEVGATLAAEWTRRRA